MATVQGKCVLRAKCRLQGDNLTAQQWRAPHSAGRCRLRGAGPCCRCAPQTRWRSPPAAQQAQHAQQAAGVQRSGARGCEARCCCQALNLLQATSTFAGCWVSTQAAPAVSATRLAMAVFAEAEDAAGVAQLAVVQDLAGLGLEAHLLHAWRRQPTATLVSHGEQHHGRRSERWHGVAKLPTSGGLGAQAAGSTQAPAVHHPQRLLALFEVKAMESWPGLARGAHLVGQVQRL